MFIPLGCGVYSGVVGGWGWGEWRGGVRHDLRVFCWDGGWGGWLGGAVGRGVLGGGLFCLVGLPALPLFGGLGRGLGFGVEFFVRCGLVRVGRGRGGGGRWCSCTAAGWVGWWAGGGDEGGWWWREAGWCEEMCVRGWGLLLGGDVVTVCRGVIGVVRGGRGVAGGMHDDGDVVC